MDYYTSAKLKFDVDRLESRLYKALSTLPNLTPERDTLDGEHAPLFKFARKVEALARRIDDQTATLAPSRTEQRGRKCQHLMDVCEELGAMLEREIELIDCEISFAYETRAFMLKETRKRLLQVAEDMRTGSLTEGRQLIANHRHRASPSSHSPSEASRGSVPVPIGSHPLRQSSPQQVGCLTPERGDDADPTPFSAMGSQPPPTPRIRNIIRLGSYQNAALFSGSPVAVAVKRRFKGPGPMVTRNEASGSRMTPPASLTNSHLPAQL